MSLGVNRREEKGLPRFVTLPTLDAIVTDFFLLIAIESTCVLCVFTYWLKPAHSLDFSEGDGCQ